MTRENRCFSLFAWPDEAVETLRRLRAEGQSSSQIAAVLGITRNAVIGKAARLGLPLSASVVQYRPSSRRPRVPKPDRVFRLPTFRAEPIPEPAPAPEHQFLNIPLLDLNRDECRYSPSTESPFLFCGQPALAGKSWCAHCAGIVFGSSRVITEEDRQRRRQWGHILGLKLIARKANPGSEPGVSRYLIDPEAA